MGKISTCAGHHVEILAMRAALLPTREIAYRVGVSTATLSTYLRRRRLLSLMTPSERTRTFPDSAVTALLSDGLRVREIADRLGVSLSCIERRLARLGLSTGRRGPRAGRGHPMWAGGRSLEKHGYIRVYAPLHPHSRRSGAVAEHRLVMEVALGRYLQPGEVVDHIDGHPRHNWPSNLRVFASNADHLRAELTAREKATPRQSIPGAYRSTEKLARCPEEQETLAQCPSEMRAMLSEYIAAHRPTKEHRHLSKRKMKLGAAHWEFRLASTA